MFSFTASFYTDSGPSLAILSSSSLSQLLEPAPLLGIATLAYSSVSMDLQKCMAYLSFSRSTTCDKTKWQIIKTKDFNNFFNIKFVLMYVLCIVYTFIYISTRRDSSVLDPAADSKDIWMSYNWWPAIATHTRLFKTGITEWTKS